MNVDATVKIDAYALLEEKFEDAIKYGVMRAWKHSDDPMPDDAKVDVIIETAWTDFCGWLKFD